MFEQLSQEAREGRSFDGTDDTHAEVPAIPLGHRHRLGDVQGQMLDATVTAQYPTSAPISSPVAMARIRRCAR